MKLSRLKRRLIGGLRPQKGVSQDGQGPVLRAISISMVKNEQDVIEPFLRHNRAFLDAMVVLDHGSTDRTAEIIRDCSRELGGIFFTHVARFDYAQSEIMTAALQHVQAACFADFVCFLDADEFIAAKDRASFLSGLSGVPVGEASEHAWQTFLPDPAAGREADGDWLPTMTLRRREERPAYSKCFIRLGGGTDPDLAVLQGNHGFTRAESEVPRHPVPEIPLQHFPVRSAPQIVTRGAVGWAANLAREGVRNAPRVATQWKRLHDIARSGRFELSRQELSDEAMAYAQTVLPETFADNAVPAEACVAADRRYSDGQPADPYRTIATSLLRTETFRPFPVEMLTPGGQEKTDITTAFDSAWHWQNFFLDAPPFRYLAQRHRPASVLDIGCGTGHYLRLLQHDGVADVLGVDGLERSATVLDDRTYITADLQAPFDAGRRFDLVLCLEVAEHVAPETTDILFDSIARNARDLIVFSMAEPGQPGNGHINCKPMAEVLALWQARGWTPDLAETLGVRALATLSWFRRNIVVLRRGLSPDTAATEALARIGSLDFTWYRQESGPRQTAFEQPFPPPTVGYGRVLGRRGG
jgi:SAM-dependent methyltransferase